MELTEEQRAIVEAGDVDLAVSAGAGSGKTHVLVERYVRLLRDCAIPEIVAITFTEAAAAEMRQRVRSEVMGRDELAEHRGTLDEAIIGTIHSLCLRLLRDHPIEAGWDPATAVLGEDEAEALRRRACVEAIDAAAEAGDERTLALGAIGLRTISEHLPSMVAARYDVRSAFQALSDDPASVIHGRLDAALREHLDPLRAEVAGTVEWVREQCLDTGDTLAQRFEAAVQALGDPTTGDADDWAARVERCASGIDLRPGSKAKWADLEAVKAELGAFRMRLQGALKAAPRWCDADDAMVGALPGLAALFEDACHRYELAKRERQGADFLDLEIRAVDLLDGHPAVVDAWRRRRRHIMVDEAQDVSPIQARLIRRLVGEGPDRPRLFLVGDEKQSIYRFRGADVRQFSELSERVRQWEGAQLLLGRSFRTHDGLLDHCNGLFAHVFADRGGVTMQALSGRPGERPAAPHLVVMPLERDSSADEARASRLVEADAIAAEIEGMLADGRPVWDKRAREYRPVRPGDIALLLRRFANVHVFEQALDARGIPYATPSGSGFFDRQEVIDVTNLLRWLAEPEDDIALVGVLRSPFFILGDDTLLELRLDRPPLLPALADPTGPIAGEERERCLLAAGTLRDLRSIAHRGSASELLAEALARTGFEATWAALNGGEQAVANIRKLARMIEELADFSLAETARYLEERRDDLDVREAPAALDRPEAVQLMTVHGAKGLEFPVVFIPECGTEPGGGGNDSIRWRADDGIAFTLERGEEDDQRPRPGFFAWLRVRDQADDLDEHVRLLYVAATRAADYLYLSGDERGSDTWMQAIRQAQADGALDSVGWRDPLPPDTSGILQRRARAVTSPATHEDYTPPLLAAPPVIPLRASTPATALRLHEVVRFAHGDGLGLVRGRVAHRALELAAVEGAAPDLGTLVQAEAPDLDAATAAVLVEEVRAMVDGFRASEIGRDIERPGASLRFELPFAWDWDGVPVHGQMDLVYQAPGAVWRVVDFKTDSLERRTAEQVAEPYLVQLGLYALALEAATGERPEAGLYFLRSGLWHEPPWDEVAAALAEAREQIDRGLRLVPDEDGTLLAHA